MPRRKPGKPNSAKQKEKGKGPHMGIKKDVAAKQMPRPRGTPNWIRTSGLPLRSLAFQFCVLLYFLYSFFSFHIMLYGGCT